MVPNATCLGSRSGSWVRGPLPTSLRTAKWHKGNWWWRRGSLWNQSFHLVPLPSRVVANQAASPVDVDPIEGFAANSLGRRSCYRGLLPIRRDGESGTKVEASHPIQTWWGWMGNRYWRCVVLQSEVSRQGMAWQCNRGGYWCSLMSWWDPTYWDGQR